MSEGASRRSPLALWNRVRSWPRSFGTHIVRRYQSRKARKVNGAGIRKVLKHQSHVVESQPLEDNGSRKVCTEETGDTSSRTKAHEHISIEDRCGTASRLPHEEYDSVDTRQNGQQSLLSARVSVSDGENRIPYPEPGKKEITGVDLSYPRAPQTYVPDVPGQSRHGRSGDEYQGEHRDSDKMVDKLREGSKHERHPFGRKETTDTNEQQAPRVSTEIQCEIAGGESRREHWEDDKLIDNETSRAHVKKPQAGAPQTAGGKARDKTADRSFIYKDQTARHFFLDAADVYTEKEAISWAKSLNARIGSLSAHLIREKNRIHGQTEHPKPYRRPDTRDSQDGQRHDRSNRVPELVEGALGTRLLAELRDAGNNGKANEDNDATIQDALDAWSVFCAHSAIKPMLFAGTLSPRSDEEIEAVLSHMRDHEPELARFWEKFLPQAEESKKYLLLEEVYLEDSIKAKHQQIALHWRATLHEHELGLPSYKSAITETEEVLLQGLLHVFALASVEPPGISQDLCTTIAKVVKDAATLAERTRTGIFSESIETVVVEAGRKFDKECMRSADGGDAGEVKCTIQLGLNATKPERRLLFPEVLLV